MKRPTLTNCETMLVTSRFPVVEQEGIIYNGDPGIYEQD